MMLPMLLVVAVLVQNPQTKPSVLGKDIPWWEKLKPGDVVQAQAIPGTAIPLIRMWRFSEAEGDSVRTDINLTLFVDATARQRWADLHKMVDRIQLHYVYARGWFQVVAIKNDPDLQCYIAEVVHLGYGDAKGTPPARGEVSDKTLSRHCIPVPYLCTLDQPRHPALAGLPVLAKRTKEAAATDCSEPNCERMEAIPYAVAEKTWLERQRRSEEIKRRGPEEAKRRQEDQRLKLLPNE